MSSPVRFIGGAHELRAAAPGFAEVVVSPEPSTRLAVPALEIELGRDIRVRIAASTPKELASAVIQAKCGENSP